MCLKAFNLSFHIIKGLNVIVSLITELLHPYLDFTLLSYFLLYLILCDGNSILGHLVSLLEVNDQFVLSPDHFFVFFDLILVHLDFSQLIVAN